MRRGLIFLAILALFLSAVATVRAAQQKKSARGSISGTVIGPDDKPAPHAAVTYQSSGGNAPHATHADSHGHFTISNLKGDNYDLRASAKGIFSEWEKNVVVRPGQQKSMTLRLIYAKEMPSGTGTPAKQKQ